MSVGGEAAFRGSAPRGELTIRKRNYFRGCRNYRGRISGARTEDRSSKYTGREDVSLCGSNVEFWVEHSALDRMLANFGGELGDAAACQADMPSPTLW